MLTRLLLLELEMPPARSRSEEVLVAAVARAVGMAVVQPRGVRAGTESAMDAIDIWRHVGRGGRAGSSGMAGRGVGTISSSYVLWFHPFDWACRRIFIGESGSGRVK